MHDPIMLQVHGAPLPTRVVPMTTEDVTFVCVEFRHRQFRFAVRGTELPFEVSYLHEFGEPGVEPHAWFTIAPEAAVEPEVLQEYLYPQLVEIHRARMIRDVAAAS